jgi:hypothetical protein
MTRITHIDKIAPVHPPLNLKADFFTLKRQEKIIKKLGFSHRRFSSAKADGNPHNAVQHDRGHATGKDNVSFEK